MKRVLSRRTKFTLAQHRHGDVLSFKFIQVLPVTGTLGAEVEGVDLTKPVPPPVVDEIHAAFLQYGVLFFRGQHGLTPHAHLAFARLFGSIQRHPIVQGMAGHPDILQIVKEPGTPTRFGEEWHSDHSFMHAPPLGSVRFGATPILTQCQANFNGTAAMTYEKGHDNSVVHPVVTIHPETGKRVLFVNPMFTQCFEHMTVRIVHESAPILSMLYGKAFRPEHQCRFRWSPGSVAFWDNRRLQHVAINDNVVSRRVMHRITIQGGVP
ncbi:hypothetical protein DYB30_006984 [Aphanomyces astaci]|uniref:TauD/TfdA-like domain-containing protein n=2 Tax=Aphanomyces astaci TaxID=112090 RepID=A0A397EX69_APHAT|nr:hypothetical protein DYB30_006984 [Aphanomyces astaci]RHY73117.1 hypothetical protein DYB34_001693 [Aphanomyces astaci]RHZ02132.1 hypothetical protein DYB31_014628 [Aphanomyces astaci]RHZ17468.1 hypothetical protein DYB26_012369 [Aphanomyces astaci]